MSAQDCNVLHADWPSQSPYVTAVGKVLSPIIKIVIIIAVKRLNHHHSHR